MLAERLAIWLPEIARRDRRLKAAREEYGIGSGVGCNGLARTVAASPSLKVFGAVQIVS
jgi:adenylosuccinate lyase